MSKRTLVVLGLWTGAVTGLTVTPAVADEAIRLDPAKICDRVARLDGAFSQPRFDACVVKEKQARDTLRGLAPIVSQEVKRRCQAESTSSDGLVRCLKREGLSILRHFDFKF